MFLNESCLHQDKHFAQIRRERMEKILSVSIASYNVEKFIRKALDSCCVPEIMDRLEVLVVNDGSTDSTLEIAREFDCQCLHQGRDR